jgi:uracil-DNA glycosylase
MPEFRLLNPLPKKWKAELESEVVLPYFKNLTSFLDAEKKAGKVIYPNQKNILRALSDLDVQDVKVVILGQDPYHGENQAIGLSFAVPNDLRLKPPSLQNIFKELESDLKITIDKTKSDLSGWVEQGVLLLNTVLTVEKNLPFSHREQGWEQFTDRIIEILDGQKKPIVFILWGMHAQKKKQLLKSGRHPIIESPHPSPLSAHRGFFGSRPFSKANAILKKLGDKEIKWSQVSVAKLGP